MVIVSASSDIATGMLRHYLEQDIEVLATYRRMSEPLSQLRGCKLLTLVKMDLSADLENNKLLDEFVSDSHGWDAVIFATGTQDPVGLFSETDFNDWMNSVSVNSLAQLQLLYRLLPARRIASGAALPHVLFFAGAGSNGAPPRYSAYIISKIILTKMVELLDVENPDVKFSIIGPGWVKTKIHQSTIDAKDRAGINYEKTLQMLRADELTPIGKIIEVFDWCISQPRDVVSGRNFSVVFDQVHDRRLVEALRRDVNMYKLRRFGNSWTGDQEK